MSQKHVRIIDVVVEEQPSGMVVATSPSLPEFWLVTKADRLDDDIPDALQRFYRLKQGAVIEVLPIEQNDHRPLVQWAAILASRPGIAA